MGVKAFIRDLNGKPAIHAGTTGHNDRQVMVLVGGKTRVLTANEWNGLLVWGGALPAGISSRYL